MTNILALSGSLRAGSFNTALARAAQQHAPQGMRIEVGTLHGVPLYDGDLETQEGIPSSVLELKARIIDADGLLLVTPEYNNGVPGVFKSAVDWLSRADRKAVFGERLVGLMGASMGGFGTLSSQHAWLPTLKALGARVYSGGMMLLSRAHTVFDAEGHLSHEDAQKMLTEYLAGYAAFVQTHRRDG